MIFNTWSRISHGPNSHF